jgi:hypothetical protein
LKAEGIAFLPKLGKEFVAGWVRFREGSKPFIQSTFDPSVPGIRPPGTLACPKRHLGALVAKRLAHTMQLQDPTSALLPMFNARACFYLCSMQEHASRSEDAGRPSLRVATLVLNIISRAWPIYDLVRCPLLRRHWEHSRHPSRAGGQVISFRPPQCSSVSNLGGPQVRRDFRQ